MKTAVSGPPSGGFPQPGEIYLVEIGGSTPRRRIEDPLAGIRRNHRITAPQVRVYSPEGKMLGILDTEEAINLALKIGLDLVEVAPGATPPVCRIMDFGHLVEHHLDELIEGTRQIGFHETVTKSALGEGKFIRQSGGKGQYGHVVIRLEPNLKNQGVEVIDEIVGGAIPKKFIEAAVAGIKEGCNNGVVAGHPVVDVIVHLVDGSFHEVDSSQLAFKMAGIFAFKDAMKQANPVLLDLRTDAPITSEARSEKVRPAVVVRVGVEGHALRAAFFARLAARGFHSTFRSRMVLCVPLTTRSHGSPHEVPLGKLPFLDEEMWAYIPGTAPIGLEKLVRLLGSVSDAQLQQVKAALG
jgi:hypothetical protein